jgi:glycine/D-amino acid oxidase-like deaminating enzyme
LGYSLSRISSQVSDVLIIGAGIVGTACADALASAGLRVIIVEKDEVGGGATAAGMGHLVVMDDNPAELALSRYSVALWQEFAGNFPSLHEYAACGTLWLAADDDDLATARAKQRRLLEHGVACELLDAASLRECEPHLRADLAGALLVPGDALVYSPKSARILLERAQSYGATFIRGEVLALTQSGVLLSDGMRIAADRVIVANGMAALQLLPELPLCAKKGHLAITDRYPNLARHQLVELAYVKSAHASSGESVAFNVQPRPTGQLLIGSSRQFDVTDTAIDHTILAKMLSRGSDYFPILPQLNVLRCWTGLRVASPDSLPLIGAHPTRANVSLAVGHEGLGITTALATAQLLAAQIMGKPSPLPIAPYLPSRFRQFEAACA